MGSRGYDMFNNALLREYEKFFKNPKTPDESFKQKSIEIMKGNELDITITDRNRSYGDSRVYRYKINGESALRFDQIPYPECCGIAIIKNFSANSDISKVDFIDAINKFIVDMQENDAFSKVLFYTNAGSNGDRLFSQIPNVIILDSFKNKRSGNTLVGFEIDLLEKKSREGWHSLDLDDEESDEEEDDGEHDEDEDQDNDPFGLREIIREQASLDENLAARTVLDSNGLPILQPVSSSRPSVVRGKIPTLSNGEGMLGHIDYSAPDPIYWSPQPYNSDNPTGINRSSDNS